MKLQSLMFASMALATTVATQEPTPTVRIEQPTCTAEFSTSHVLLRNRPAHAGQSSPQLQLRYLAARRTAGAAATRSPVAAPVQQQDQSHVRYQHGNVVEAYRIDEAGFEQSFHFAERPDGHGDLVIAIAASGNVQASACAPAHQELQFRFEQRAAIRYGEAIAFDRGGLRTDVLTSYDGHGRIELRVPATFVDQAVFPIVVDPAVTPILHWSPHGSNRHADVAYDVVADRYLTVWDDGGDLKATLGDIVGVTVTTVASGVVGPTDATVASCRATAGNAFLVVWQQAGQVRGRLIDANTAAPLAATFVINSPGAGESCRRPTVTSADSVGMIVAWDLTFAGESSPRSIRSRELYWPNPAIASGVTVGPQRILRSVTSGYVQNARLSRGSHARWVSGGYWTHSRIVWERFFTTPAPGDFDLETCSFRARPATAQFSLLQAPTAVLGASQIGGDEHEHDIGSMATTFYNPSEQQYCVAWNDDGDVRACMYDDNGPTTVPFPVRATPLDESQPRVGSGTCEFTIAYGEAASPSAGQLDVYAARVLRDGTVATDHVLVDGQSNVLRERLAISSRPIHPTSGNHTNRTLIVWENTAQFDGVIGRMFEPVTATFSPYGIACPGPLGELPTIGTQGGNPVPGNSYFRVKVDGAPSNRLAVLVMSNVLASTPIPGAPGCSLYVGLPLLAALPTVTNAVGHGTTPLPLPCTIPHGFTLACQWGVYAPSANAFGWIVSNDIDITWSH